MYLDQLCPRNDYTEYLPEFVIHEDTPREVFPTLFSELLRKNGPRVYVGFVAGATNLSKIINGEREKTPTKEISRWFSTDEITDVRVFFRSSKHDDSQPIGSKMRLYSLGKPFRSKSEDLQVQHIDSGFLQSSVSDPVGSLAFQSAIARTMLYNSLYCLGGPALIRKVSVESEEGDKHKWISSIRPKYSEKVDRRAINHILTPAGMAAGIDDPVSFFGSQVLDDVMECLISSRSMDDFADNIMDRDSLSFVFDEDIEEIIDLSNSPEANHSRVDDFEEGIDIVTMMRVLKKAKEMDT